MDISSPAPSTAHSLRRHSPPAATPPPIHKPRIQGPNVDFSIGESAPSTSGQIPARMPPPSIQASPKNPPPVQRALPLLKLVPNALYPTTSIADPQRHQPTSAQPLRIYKSQALGDGNCFYKYNNPHFITL